MKIVRESIFQGPDQEEILDYLYKNYYLEKDRFGGYNIILPHDPKDKSPKYLSEFVRKRLIPNENIYLKVEELEPGSDKYGINAYMDNKRIDNIDFRPLIDENIMHEYFNKNYHRIERYLDYLEENPEISYDELPYKYRTIHTIIEKYEKAKEKFNDFNIPDYEKALDTIENHFQ